MAQIAQNGQVGQQAAPLGMNDRISKSTQIVTTVIFWLAFISFLSTSIPHVAWLYNVYEPQDQPIWWVMCYAVAISIDVMIAWLSFVQTISRVKDSWLTWVFIGLLSALSWYANYLYDMRNNPIVQHDMWNIHIFFGYTTTGYITPIIISGIPLFSIAYTFMLSKVGNRNVETVAEMRARLADLKARKHVEDELRSVGKVDLKAQLKARIDDAKEVISYVKAEQREITQDDGSVDASLQPVDERFIDSLIDDEEDASVDATEDAGVDTGERETVTDQMTPLPRITVNLENIGVSKKRDTDKLKPSSSASSKKPTTGEGEAARRIRRMVKKNPNIQPTEIAQKVNVTRQYASKIKAQVLNEEVA